IAGKWALCLDNGRGRSRRGNTAQAAGALGLLTFPGAEYDEEPYVERFSVPMATLTRGQVSYPDGPKVESGFPQLFLTRERGLELLERSPARPEEVAAADWMPELGTALGMRATESRQLQFENGRIALENVCGFWPGADPELSKEVILVSAHYDHVGARGGEIYNGADDNGTGTCGLLALSEALATYGPLNRSVLLIWVSGEEKGLLGSKAWADDPWLPDGHRAVANINIDMIGRNSSDQLLYTPTSRLKEFYNGLAQVTEALAPLEGFSDLGSADAYYHRSDQAEFERLGIPVMFLFSDIHDDYHKPTDTPDKIDTDKVRRVVRLVLRMLVELEDGLLER
ncbi:MAG: M28 family metallopeptidase, partial [Planctomycetota bacterium]